MAIWRIELFGGIAARRGTVLVRRFPSRLVRRRRPGRAPGSSPFGRGSSGPRARDQVRRWGTLGTARHRARLPLERRSRRCPRHLPRCARGNRRQARQYAPDLERAVRDRRARARGPESRARRPPPRGGRSGRGGRAVRLRADRRSRRATAARIREALGDAAVNLESQVRSLAGAPDWVGLREAKACRSSRSSRRRRSA